MAEDELEEIRRRKLMQMQREQEAARQQEQAMLELEAKKQAILRQILTPEARERLNTLKMTRPELVSQLESQLILLAQSGRLEGKIDDARLRTLLLQIQPKKRDIKIKRI